MKSEPFKLTKNNRYHGGSGRLSTVFLGGGYFHHFLPMISRYRWFEKTDIYLLAQISESNFSLTPSQICWMITSANTHRSEACNHCRLTSPSQETITLTIVTSAVRTKPTVLIKQTFASPLSPLSPLLQRPIFFFFIHTHFSSSTLRNNFPSFNPISMAFHLHARYLYIYNPQFHTHSVCINQLKGL
ncbi:hypothetical protein Hanom_Chr12g01169121 [Helianthus anomalus]